MKLLTNESQAWINWLTENISNGGGPKGGEKGSNEGILEERHVLELAAGVQAGNCRQQIREKIHLWNTEQITIQESLDFEGKQMI